MQSRDIRGNKKQAGFTVIELVVVLGVMAVGIVGAGIWYSAYTDKMTAINTATQHMEVVQAARHYLNDHYTDLADSLNNSRVEKISDVISEGYLDNTALGTGHKNALGQTYKIFYYQKGDSDPIKTLIIASGNPGTSRQVQFQMVKNMGTKAAYVEGGKLESPYYGDDFGYSLGTFGQSSVADGSVAWFDSQERSVVAKSDYLYRHAVAGFPELNQMATDLDMDGNDINGVGKLDAKNVEASQDVTAGRHLSAGQDVRANRDAVINRDVNAGRNISAAQDLIAERNLKAQQDVIANRDVTAGRNVEADQDIAAGRDVTADQDVTAARDVDAGRYMHLTDRGHKDGDSCTGAGQGAVTVDSEGKILSCQSGRWSKTAKPLSCYQTSQFTNSNKGVASCKASYTATGGGCVTKSPGSDNYAMSSPLGTPPSGWQCQSNDNGLTVYAVCCN